MNFSTVAFVVAFVTAACAFATEIGDTHPAAPAPLPRTLSATGLFADAADGTPPHIAADVAPFSPQYPLWSDGATKRRWIRLPPGTSIDAAQPDAWQFPIGTRLWKEFAHDRRVKTRFIERVADGSWRYATYVWNEAGTDATLAPEFGAVLPPRPIMMYRNLTDDDFEAIYSYLRTVPSIRNKVPEPLPPAVAPTASQ